MRENTYFIIEAGGAQSGFSHRLGAALFCRADLCIGAWWVVSQVLLTVEIALPSPFRFGSSRLALLLHSLIPFGICVWFYPYVLSCMAAVAQSRSCFGVWSMLEATATAWPAPKKTLWTFPL